jgi:hypothetical protein
VRGIVSHPLIFVKLFFRQPRLRNQGVIIRIAYERFKINSPESPLNHLSNKFIHGQKIPVFFILTTDNIT